MGETQEKQRKKRVVNILIVILLIVTAIATSVVLYAWAKYTSVKAGDATAQVAKWHFELVDGIPKNEDGIDFPITRTDENDTVEKDKLAPGTSGEFQVIMDSTGTEVSYRYDIKIEVENCPTNLNFYTDSKYESKIETTRSEEKVQDDGETTLKIATFTISKYVSVERANNQFSEIIYWDWPYETEGADGSTDENDKIDTMDKGKDMKMKITVVGTEVMDNSEELPEGTQYVSSKLSELVKNDKIKIGDYVNYDATKGEDGSSISENIQCTISNEETDSEASRVAQYTFTAKGGEQIKWRVLNIDKVKGTIDIMAVSEIKNDNNQDLYLRGKDAFINSKKILNKICTIYGYGYGAESARSIKIGDIVQFTNYDPKKDSCSQTDTNFCGGKNKNPYTGSFFKETIDEETGEVIGYEEPAEDKKSEIGIIHQTDYCLRENNVIEKDGISKESIVDMIFRRSYWIASRCVNLSSSSCNFCVRYVKWDSVWEAKGRCVYDSYGRKYGQGCGVCPVVTLKSDIQLEKENETENAAWNIKIEN